MPPPLFSHSLLFLRKKWVQGSLSVRESRGGTLPSLYPPVLPFSPLKGEKRKERGEKEEGILYPPKGLPSSYSFLLPERRKKERQSTGGGLRTIKFNNK
jgi:hypothetical protein